jgi:S-adenosylmethionine hydrolase
MPIITLTTDFGNDDPFDGVMKGVILNISPDVKIVDLTHNVLPQDIYQANFLLSACYHYFPEGTIHVCVVDPGVGSQRKPVLIQTKKYFFIGPDNGLFTSVLEKEEIVNVVELTEKKYWLSNVSQTFHGRDIFAPVAAHLTKGVAVNDFGKQINRSDLVKLKINKPIKTDNGYKGIIQYIDHFGNLITNISSELINGKVKGKLKNHYFQDLVSSFAEAKNNTLTAIKGSSGYLELFVYKGNAQMFADLNVGDEVEIALI